MDIKYYVNDDKQVVVAVALSPQGYADGIDPVVADRLVELGYASKAKLMSPGFVRGKAQPGEGDVYDAEIGMKVARDKAIARYYSKVAVSKKHYAEALEKMLRAQNSDIKFCDEKVANAESRLAEY